MSDLDKLEARVAADRAALSHSLADLTDSLSPRSVGARLDALAKGYGGEIGRQVYDVARSNPAAVALVGTGLALLATGTGKTQRAPETTAPQGNFDTRVRAADKAMRREMTGEMSSRPSAAQLSAALDRGLDRLPPKARDRVLKARKSAIAAQERVEAQARRAYAKSQRGYMEQPLAAGALAVGLGAIVGALLPGTRQEDRMLGARRDALMDDARAILSEEMEKLHAVAANRLSDVTEPRAHTH